MYVIIDNKKYRVYFKNGQYFITTRKVEKHKVNECDIKDDEPIAKKSKKNVNLQTLKENDKKMREIIARLNEKLEICSGLYSILTPQSSVVSPIFSESLGFPSPNPSESHHAYDDVLSDKDDVIASLRSEILQSRAAIDRVNEEREQALLEVDRYMAELTRLKNDSPISTEEKNQLTDNIKSLGEASEKLKRDCDTRVYELNNKIKDLQRELDEIAGYNSKLAEHITELQGTSTENKAKIAQLEEQIEIHRNTNKDLNAQLQENIIEIDRYMKDLTEIRHNSGISTEEKMKLTAEIQRMTQVLQQLQESHQERVRLSDTLIKDLQDEIHDLLIQIDSLKVETIESKQHLRDLSISSRDQIDDLHKKIGTLNDEKREKILEINKYIEQLNALKTAPSANDEEKTRLTAEIQTMKLYIEQMAKEHQERLDVLTNKIRDLEQDILKRGEYLQELEKTKNTTTKALKDAEDALHAMELRNGELISQLRNPGTVDSDLEQKLQQCNELSTIALEKLKADVSKCTEDLATCNKHNDTIFAKMNDESIKVQQLLEKNKDLDLELQLLTNTNTDLTSRLDEALIKSQCEDEVKTIEGLREELTSDMELREREKNKCLIGMKDLRAKNEQYENELASVNSLTDVRNKDIQDLKDEFFKHIEVKDTLIERLQTELGEAIKSSKEFRKENQTLTDKLGENDETINKLTSDLDEQASRYQRKITADSDTIQLLTAKVYNLQEESKEQDDEISKAYASNEESRRIVKHLQQRLGEYDQATPN